MSCLVTLFLVPVLGLIYDAGGQLYFFVILLEGKMLGKKIGYQIPFGNTIFISPVILILSMSNTGYNYL